MKKQKKQLILLGIVLILVLGAYIGLRIYNKNNIETVEESTAVTVTDFSVDDVTKLNIVFSETNLTFVKEEDNWYYEADKTLDIEESTINTLLYNINNITSENLLESPQLSDYGLENPAQTMTVTTAEQEYTFVIGTLNNIISQYYFYVNDPAKVYTITASSVTDFQKAIEEYIAVADETTSE